MSEPLFEPDDLMYALENAAEFLENEEWPDPDGKEAQEAANREGAKRIRRMVARIVNKLDPNPHTSHTPNPTEL